MIRLKELNLVELKKQFQTIDLLIYALLPIGQLIIKYTSYLASRKPSKLFI